MTDFLKLGERGEALAWNFLRKRGYAILEKNYRIRLGEIDIIAQKEGAIVFIEVKTRRNHAFGSPEEAIDHRKRLKLARVSQAYLQTKKWEEKPARFDILSLTWDGVGEPEFSLIEDAFSLEEI